MLALGTGVILRSGEGGVAHHVGNDVRDLVHLEGGRDAMEYANETGIIDVCQVFNVDWDHQFAITDVK